MPRSLPPHAARRLAALGAGLLLVTVTACTLPPPDTSWPEPPPPPAVSRPPSTTPPPVPGRWRPALGTAWQIQLSTPVDLSVDVPVYDIDGENNPASVVAELHARGRRVICYIDVGGAEIYRSDYHLIPASTIGRVVDGWPQERWLDVRQIEALRPVMTARMDMCRSKGFDAVDPDMLEAFAADTGFPITYQDQLRYNRFIAGLAHERGMSVGLKGNVEQVRDLLADFDFTVNEQCAQYDECDTVAAFARAGKAVLHIEYDLTTAQFCPVTRPLGFSSLRKRLSLDAWRQTC